jgi:hypothetical protein
MKSLAHARDAAELLRRLKHVREDSIRRWGRMSAHQMVCHLADAYRMLVEEKPVSHVSTWPQRTVIKWAALYLPMKWPSGIPTRPEIDQAADGTKPTSFEADVATLEVLVGLVVAGRGTYGRRVHPIFGRMSEPAWLRWAYLHMDHHLRQFGA